MRYFLQAIAFFSSVILFSSCNKDNGTAPDTGPYLYIHSGQFEDYQLEKWIIITNGNGEIVGYKKIDATSDESILTKRSASIKDKINVYKITIAKPNTTAIDVEVMAVLGVQPGQHCYLGSKVSATSGKTLNATLIKIPEKSFAFAGTGSFGMSQTDYTGGDGLIDSTKISFSGMPSTPVYQVIVYTREAPKYVNVNYAATGATKFNYPGDFLNFDHVIDVPTGKTPTLVLTSGIKAGVSFSFSALFSPFDMNKVDANQSIKLCYNDGYESYSTTYHIDNKWYFRNGSIPLASSAIIPNRSVVVNSHDLYSFAATLPAEIDYRSSGYSYSEIIGGVTNYYALSITSDVKRNDSFDLKLPDEFVTAHGSTNFTKYNYTTSSFYEFENNEKYSNAVDILFAVPGGNNSVGRYAYDVN